MPPKTDIQERQDQRHIAASAPAARLDWLDAVKGISILWIVFFHFFETYTNSSYPWFVNGHYFATFLSRCAPVSTAARITCLADASLLGLVEIGFHAVAVFIVLSGFGLSYSLAKTGGPEHGWSGWYRARVLRLFPVYWLAHLLYLISPFQARLEPVDYRFVLSLLGDRVFPVDTLFYYLNPAWWYFGLLLELYLLFPFLFRLLQKVGPVWFLILCGLETVGSRFALLSVLHADGRYVQGAFCGCRLWEFAAGMVAGVYFRERPELAQKRLFAWSSLLAAVAIYALGLSSYHSPLTYTVTDALTGTGLTIILAHVARLALRLSRLGSLLAYIGAFSYGLYLFHQPYVIYFGVHLRHLGMLEFLAVAAVIIALLTAGSMILERTANRLVDQLLRGVSVSQHSPAPQA